MPQQAEGAQRQSIWNKLSEHTEDYLNGLPVVYSIDSLRREISNQCLAAARERAPGIYRLYIPTGGGKTYSGLRFCIEMARRQNARHIFYFSPYKSITRQNADCIRNALGEEFVLEHHSDVTFEESEEETREQWLAQSQRWQGTPVICTTMVQFLNSLFAAPRQNVRRLSALAGSVLLFDGIQSLPPVSYTHLTKIAFMIIDFIRPAILFRKLGLPQATICRIIEALKRGLQKRN